MADLDENIIRRSLPFGVDTSIGAVETHANENLILRDFEICDYSDRLLGSHEREMLLRKARQAETAMHINDWLSSPGLQAPKAVQDLFPDTKK